MTKYMIQWNEYTIQEGKELKSFMKSLPNPKVVGNDGDSTIIRCTDTFSAKNDAEAKKYVSNTYDDVETAYDVTKNGKIVFTEEDIGGD